MSTYVVPLAHVRLADADRVGRKAAVLGELAAAGFAVPDGFVVTVDAPDSGELMAELATALAALGAHPGARGWVRGARVHGGRC
jgi:phosphoenolpyruvate synthase/pyruvate phosphate dikinase